MSQYEERAEDELLVAIIANAHQEQGYPEEEPEPKDKDSDLQHMNMEESAHQEFNPLNDHTYSRPPN